MSEEKKEFADFQKSINSDLMHFKDDILKQIREIEVSAKQKSEQKIEDIETKILGLEENDKALNSKFEEVKSGQGFDFSKLDKIDEMKESLNQQNNMLISHDIKLKTLQKDYSNSCYKYDRAVIDNLSIPGLLGEYGKFKNLKEFINNMLEQINSLMNARDKTIMDFKTYKTKIDGLLKQNNFQIENLKQNATEYTNIKIAESELQRKKENEEIKGFLNSWKEENAIYIVSIKEKQESFQKDLEKIESIKEEIKKGMDDTIKKNEKMNSEVISTFGSIKSEFREIKKAILDLTKFLSGENGLLLNRQDPTLTSDRLRKEIVNNFCGLIQKMVKQIAVENFNKNEQFYMRNIVASFTNQKNGSALSGQSFSPRSPVKTDNFIRKVSKAEDFQNKELSSPAKKKRTYINQNGGKMLMGIDNPINKPSPRIKRNSQPIITAEMEGLSSMTGSKNSLLERKDQKPNYTKIAPKSDNFEKKTEQEHRKPPVRMLSNEMIKYKVDNNSVSQSSGDVIGSTNFQTINIGRKKEEKGEEKREEKREEKTSLAMYYKDIQNVYNNNSSMSYNENALPSQQDEKPKGNLKNYDKKGVIRSSLRFSQNDPKITKRNIINEEQANTITKDYGKTITNSFLHSTKPQLQLNESNSVKQINQERYPAISSGPRAPLNYSQNPNSILTFNGVNSTARQPKSSYQERIKSIGSNTDLEETKSQNRYYSGQTFFKNLNLSPLESRVIEFEFFTKRKFEELVKEIRNYIPINFNTRIKDYEVVPSTVHQKVRTNQLEGYSLPSSSLKISPEGKKKSILGKRIKTAVISDKYKKHLKENEVSNDIKHPESAGNYTEVSKVLTNVPKTADLKEKNLLLNQNEN